MHLHDCNAARAQAHRGALRSARGSRGGAVRPGQGGVDVGQLLANLRQPLDRRLCNRFCISRSDHKLPGRANGGAVVSPGLSAAAACLSPASVSSAAETFPPSALHFAASTEAAQPGPRLPRSHLRHESRAELEEGMSEPLAAGRALAETLPRSLESRPRRLALAPDRPAANPPTRRVGMSWLGYPASINHSRGYAML